MSRVAHGRLIMGRPIPIRSVGGSGMGARAIQRLLIVLGSAAAAGGAYLRTIVTEGKGDNAFHGWGSLGVALLTMGVAVVAMGSVALAWPRFSAAAASALKARIDTPARLLAVALALGIVATVLLAITADVGGFVVYHPYEWMGIGLGLGACTLALRGVLGFRKRRSV